MTLIAQDKPEAKLRTSWSALATPATYLFAAALAFVFFFIVYPDPVTFLRGDGVYFETGDTPQHVSGWLLYAKDAWRWPLLTTQMIAAPQGSHIALSDTIPLAALIFKPLATFLWNNFHYFGLWHLAAKVLQAVGAVFLIRSLGHRTVAAGIVAAALALLWPSMLFRLQHTALMTHGALLFALGFYFRALAHEWSMGRLCAAFSPLLLAALLIHPYLFAMTFPLFLATAWDRWGGFADWQALAKTIGIVSFSVAVPAVLLGYGSAAGSNAGGGGYDIYSMNLLSPVCGGALSPCGHVDATGGQYEGFNYLGLGSLLIVAAGIVLAAFGGSSVRSWVRSHPGLTVILAGLTLYALSGHIYFGQHQLTNLSYPFPLTALANVFRASGRFFWPVGYALVFLALAMVLRRRALISLAILPVALVLQWQDTAYLRRDTRTFLTAPAPFDYSGWPTFAGRIQRIDVRPEHGCTVEIETMRYIYFQIVAARLGVPINTAYQARNSARCGAPSDAANGFDPGVLYVNLAPTEQDIAAPQMQSALRSGQCLRWNAWHGLTMCLAGSTAEDWASLNIAP